MANPRNIFVIDDDGDFVSLLTEILTQAGYAVESTTQSAAVLPILEKKTFDLIVIDQRLGEQTGVQLLAKIRERDRETPAIVVSGFLEHSSAQEFINLGVAGIFFKPLNIFALLKRVEELFKGLVKSSGSVAADLGIRGFTRTPFSSAVSREVFLKKLQALADFKGNLLLVGDVTSPFQAVAEELLKHGAAGEKLLDWKPEYIREETLLAALGSAPAVSFLAQKVEDISAGERAVFYKLAKKESPFDKTPPLRFLFCLDKELDALYEGKVIDDEFYLFLGNLELKLPKAPNPNTLHKGEGLQKAVQNLGGTTTPFKGEKGEGRVLVVDDEDLHAQMVVDLLESAGRKALKLNSASEALVALRKERFCLIITDFRMPGINGVDFVAQARAVDPSVPIFIVTGNIQLPEVVRIGNMGITRLIQKPLDAKKFLQEVEAVVKK